MIKVVIKHAFILSFRGCGFEDNCPKEEICFDTNKTNGEFECMKIGINFENALAYAIRVLPNVTEIKYQ